MARHTGTASCARSARTAAPWSVVGLSGDAWHDGDPEVIEKHGAELLIADDSDFGTGYALDPTTGIWRSGGAAWARWLVAIAGDMTGEAVRSGLTGRALTAAVGQIQRVKRPGMVNQIRPMLLAVLGHLRDAGQPCPDVTECRADELDANMRYLGTASGVVDLHVGHLLAPPEGRTALVTWQTPVAFDPAAQHPAVDRLFAHLDPAAVGWWWRVLGFHLLGAPSRRFYVAVGPPSGGKSTLANAIAGTLGPYASRPADDALESRGGGSAGLSPELEAFTAPRRWAVIDEAPRMRIAAPLLKRLSGDASQTFRRLHEQLRTVPATATVLVICNPGSVPKLRLQDEAMADRLRELPYPAVTTPDPSMKSTIETPDFRRAFLARLVAAAAAETPRVPPDDVPVVRAATDERVREDVGELGEFARRMVRGGDQVSFASVWSAWCGHNEEAPQASEAGGIARRSLSGALRGHVPGLPMPKQSSVNGTNGRRWRGWQLLDAAPDVTEKMTPAEPAHPPAAHPDLLVKLSAPVVDPGDGSELIPTGTLSWSSLYHAMIVQSQRLAADDRRHDWRITTTYAGAAPLSVQMEFTAPKENPGPDPSLPLFEARLVSDAAAQMLSAKGPDRRLTLTEPVIDPNPEGGGAVWIEAGEYDVDDLDQRLDGCRKSAPEHVARKVAAGDDVRIEWSAANRAPWSTAAG